MPPFLAQDHRLWRTAEPPRRRRRSRRFSLARSENGVSRRRRTGRQQRTASSCARGRDGLDTPWNVASCRPAICADGGARTRKRRSAGCADSCGIGRPCGLGPRNHPNRFPRELARVPPGPPMEMPCGTGGPIAQPWRERSDAQSTGVGRTHHLYYRPARRHRRVRSHLLIQPARDDTGSVS